MVSFPQIYRHQLLAAVLATYFVTTAMGCGDHKRDSMEGAVMGVNQTSLMPQDIMGNWVHSYEEDSQDGSTIEIYRSSEYPFPLVGRERRGFDLREGSQGSIRGIAPAGGYVSSEMNWALESGNVLVIRERGGAVSRLRVEEVGADRLVLRELRDTN